MGVDTRLHVPTDATDLGPETSPQANVKSDGTAGDLYAAAYHQQEDTRWRGSKNYAARPQAYPLGVTASLTVPTSVNAATGAGAAGTFDLTCTPGAGNDAVEYSIFVDKNAGSNPPRLGALAKKLDDADGTVSPSGLTPGGKYVVIARGIKGTAAPYKVGAAAAPVQVTAHA